MNLRKFIKELLFKENLTCNICGREIFDGSDFCHNCAADLFPLTNGGICGRCGRKTLENVPYCEECKGENIRYDTARSAFLYSPEISRLIYKCKDGGAVYLCNLFARHMMPIFNKYFFRTQLIVPVPASQSDLSLRGFCHTLKIAEILSKHTNTLLLTDAVIKAEGFPAQKTLDKAHRPQNALKMYRLKKRAVFKDKTVLIIDDVLTTGATANALAQKIKKAGASNVYVLTFASVAAKGGT